MEHFELTYTLHWIPTPNGNRPYACRMAWFKKMCAIWDWLRDHGGKADPDLVQKMRGKIRHLWTIKSSSRLCRA